MYFYSFQPSKSGDIRQIRARNLTAIDNSNEVILKREMDELKDDNKKLKDENSKLIKVNNTLYIWGTCNYGHFSRNEMSEIFHVFV